MNKLSTEDYRRLGGVDTAQLYLFSGENIFLGNYNTFITPAINGRLVYYPRASHIGLSCYVEKNFGGYAALNAAVGIPVVLINKAGKHSFNLEFCANSFDIANNLKTGKSFAQKTSVAVSIGVPFSNIVY